MDDYLSQIGYKLENHIQLDKEETLILTFALIGLFQKTIQIFFEDILKIDSNINSKSGN